MTKDEGDTNHISKQTVSTAIDIQTSCEKNSSVKLDSNLSKIDKENISKAQSSEISKNEIEVDKINLISDKMGNGVQNSSNDKVTEETEKIDSAEKDEEIEEEDVPGDFFDDFFKEDFMEGLDIVDDDAWDEDKMKKETVVVNEESKVVSEDKTEKPKKKKQKSASKIDHVERFRTSPPGEKRHKQKKKKHEEKSGEQKPKKSKEKIIDADEFDIRRDPEKTKRDIERDKARCEKDKEKKIISEKLSLVETGLVPPGMEMEIDIEEVKRQKEKIEQNKPPRDLREHLRNLRSRSKSPSRKQRSPRKKSIPKKSVSPFRRSSPKRRRTRSPVLRGRSPARISPLRRSPHKRSPLGTNILRRSPFRRSSPRRSPLRSPAHRSQERNYGEKRIRRSRSHSPYYRSRRIRYSPLHRRQRERSASRESEREIWLKRRRSRSRSPRRKREEKKSFLQEIAEKLNETRPQPVNIMPTLQPMHFVHPQPIQPVPMPVPAPVPVPAPANTPYFAPQSQPQPQPQPQQQYDPYDQNFFIGTPQPVGPPNFIGQSQSTPMSSIGLPQIQSALKPNSAQPIASPQTPVIPSIGSNTALRNLGNFAPHTQENVKADSKEEIAKLFQDKKITLSEFLAITAKPEVASSSPAHLQEKIKVISRCQEAIKILGSNEKKYTGKLIVQHTDNYKPLEQKDMSPLVRMPPVIFPFTQHQAKKEQKTTFSNFINHLLQKIGVMKETVVDVEEMSASAGISPTTRKLSPPPPPLITSNRNIVLNETKTVKFNKLGSNQLSKMVQTDVFKCETCEIRKKILHKTSAVQCGGNTTTFSVSTQVTENDFCSKIPITQSLASLTPAQLLAKSRSGLESSTPTKFSRGSIDKDHFDIGPSKMNSYINRPNFPRSMENYNLPRYNPPSPPLHYNLPTRDEPLLPPMYTGTNPLRSQFIGGGGRGRAPQLNLSRTSDPSNRFGYNNYF